ncbi:hypothetical protein EDC04DRAFT_2712284 [Pisolithus marmoratus]|nr:hypothetical protein EDC04DRAFT_2712284 [Pisolithus marmoratus]
MKLPLDTPFLSRLRSYEINHVFRGVKYHARVPVPDSYMLPGVADEGSSQRMSAGDSRTVCTKSRRQ